MEPNDTSNIFERLTGTFGKYHQFDRKSFAYSAEEQKLMLNELISAIHLFDTTAYKLYESE